MSLKVILNLNSSLSLRLQSVVGRRCFASANSNSSVYEGSDVVDITKADEAPVFESTDDYITEEIQAKRNKSGLAPQHRNILYGQQPYKESFAWHHDTLRYKRRMLGRYGMAAAGAPPGIAWPTVEELADKKEYESVAFPYTLQDRWAKLAKKRKEEAEVIVAREKEIIENIAKHGALLKDLEKRIKEKSAKFNEAKKHKEMLMEDVRRHFGYNISPHDPKFKELLKQKEDQQKKLKKMAKKKLQQEKLLERIKTLENAAQSVSEKAKAEEPSKAEE